MEKISLSAPGLDALLGGGLESGIITNFYGAAGAGKTNIAIQASVSCLKNGKKVVYIDAEGGFSVERFLQIHTKEDLENIILMEPKSFTEQDKAVNSLETLAESEKIGLIVLDSLVALYRLDLHKDRIHETNRLLSKQLAILSKIARENKIPVLITNQVYSDFDTGDVELVGRDIPKYASKCLVKLEKINTGKRRATLVKHRSRPEGISAEFEIREKGIFDHEKKFKLFCF